MRLSTYILENLEGILQEWEKFAATLVPPEQQSDRTMLRDHAKQMLETIAADLDSPETPREKIEKSKGLLAPAIIESAAATHGAVRWESGFSLDSAVAEYRALRASVTRLWQEAYIHQPGKETAINDLIRFNEAIDQAICESVASYSFAKEEQTQMFDTILSSSPDLSFTFALDGRFSYANKALTELLEIPLNKIVGKSIPDVGLPDAVELQRQVELAVTSKEQVRGEMRYTTPSGKSGIYDYIFVPVLNKQGTVSAVIGTARNITERKAGENKNWEKANYDFLTGLPNRRLFHDRLDQFVKHAGRIGEPIALLFIDLDHFKEANDRLGHDAGDLLLKLTADRIVSCVRATDSVARLGGDEFTVIMQDLSGTKSAEIVAGKILKELAKPFHIFNDTVHISSSIGITLSDGGITPEELIKTADQAMYMSKNAGRNRYRVLSPSQPAVAE